MQKNCLALSQINLHNIALSNKEGVFNLYIPNDFESNEGTASLEPIENSKRIEVATTTLDSQFHDQTIDIMKIDVEGHEMEVFKGAKSLIRKKQIKNIIFEEFGGSQAETIKFLEASGYDVHRLHKGFLNLKLLSPKEGEFMPLWEPPNYLATVSPLNWGEKKYWDILKAK